MTMFENVPNLIGQQILYAFLVACVVTLVIRYGKVKSPLLRQGLWSLVLLRLILPLDLSSPFSLREAGDQLYVFAKDTAHQTLPASLNPVEEVAIDAAPLLYPEPVRSFEAPSQYRGNARAVSDVNLGALPTAETGEMQLVAYGPGFWNALLFGLWLLGVVVFGSQYARNWRHYRTAVRQGCRIVDAENNDVLQFWRRAMGVSRRVHLIAGDNQISPFTMGVFRPVIFVPQALMEQGREKALDAALGHEMAHIRRLDDVWIKFEAVIKIIYFFFPVVWWVGARIEAAREEACDALALHKGGRLPKTYANGLLSALKLTVQPKSLAPSPGLTQNMKGLRDRLVSLNSKKESRIAMFRSLAIIAVVGGCTLPLAQASNEQSEEPSKPQQVESAFSDAETSPLMMDDGVSTSFGDAEADQEFTLAMRRFNAQMAQIPAKSYHPHPNAHKPDRIARRIHREVRRELADVQREMAAASSELSQDLVMLGDSMRDLHLAERDDLRALRAAERKKRAIERELMELQKRELPPEEREEARQGLYEEMRKAEERAQMVQEKLDEMRLKLDRVRTEMQERVLEHKQFAEIQREAMAMARDAMERANEEVSAILESEEFENLQEKVEEAVRRAHEKARKSIDDAMQSVEKNKENNEK